MDQGGNLYHRLPLQLRYIIFDLVLERENRDLVLFLAQTIQFNMTEAIFTRKQRPEVGL